MREGRAGAARGQSDSSRFYQLLDELRETHEYLVASQQGPAQEQQDNHLAELAGGATLRLEPAADVEAEDLAGLSPLFETLTSTKTKEPKLTESMLRCTDLPGGAIGPTLSMKSSTCTKERISQVEREVRKTMRVAEQTKKWSRRQEGSRLQKLMLHPASDYISGLLIITNAAVVSFEIEVMLSGTESKAAVVASAALNVALGVCFMVEFFLRVVAFGLRTLFKEDLWGNSLDFFCVAGSLFEIVSILIFALAQIDLTDSAIVRMMQMLRILRVFRSVRILKFIGPLRILIVQIMSALKNVVWCLVLLLGISYLFALVFGIFIVASDSAEIPPHWDGLINIVTTLYKAVTGGFDWEEPATSIGAVHPALFWVMVLYISVVLFAVLNVVTGVFCQKAIKSASEDIDNLVGEHFEEKRNFLEKTKDLFELLDDDGSNQLDLAELGQKEMDAQVSGYLAFMGLEVESWADLFSVVDCDGDGQVCLDEFVEGVLRLRGPAKSIDLAKLILDCRQSKQAFDSLAGRMERGLAVVIRRLDDAERLHRRAAAAAAAAKAEVEASREPKLASPQAAVLESKSLKSLPEVSAQQTRDVQDQAAIAADDVHFVGADDSERSLATPRTAECSIAAPSAAADPRPAGTPRKPRPKPKKPVKETKSPR